MTAPLAQGTALLGSLIPCLASDEKRGFSAQLLAAPLQSRRAALPSELDRTAAVVVPSGTAEGGACLLVLEEESSL